MARVFACLIGTSLAAAMLLACSKTCVDDGLHSNQSACLAMTTGDASTGYHATSSLTTTTPDPATTTGTTFESTTDCSCATGSSTSLPPDTTTTNTTTGDDGTTAPVDPCTDDTQNNDETDVDCGGSCDPCDLSLMCEDDLDCQSGLCHPALGFCTLPTCFNGVFDPGSEWYLDCGGDCGPACKLGYPCEDDNDCAAGMCFLGKCANSMQCADGLQNGNETWTDCGGDCGPTCKDFDNCLLDSDCYSNDCSGGCFPPPHCTNQAKDPDELGPDCGGECTRCDVGGPCVFDSDCDDSSCVGFICTV